MQTQSDHDLLVTLVANVGTMREEMRQNNLQFNTQASDHEMRIRALERISINTGGEKQGRHEMSNAVKGVIGVLTSLLAVSVAVIALR